MEKLSLHDPNYRIYVQHPANQWISRIRQDWIQEKLPSYTYYYQKSDLAMNDENQKMLNAGVTAVEVFFKKPYPKAFNVFIHPGRESWDIQYRKAYNLPDFKSECWMVASGDGIQLNLISPAVWDKEACEHRYSEKDKTQKLITHELIHVFHGQQNVSPDFSDSEGLDWFIEGVATYASGQLDENRKREISKLVSDNLAPASLDDYWKGPHRYGLSGSVVMFIDQHFGRDVLIRLLHLSKKKEVLADLKVSESELLAQWKGFVSKNY